MNARVENLDVVEHQAQRRPGLLPPTVVLVHGSLDRGASFARVVRRLEDLHVVTYDRRGYNHSRVSEQPGAADAFSGHVEDLVKLVGSGPAVVVGHSFGGDLALAAALEAPGPVLAVGAYEPPMPWVEWWPRRQDRERDDSDPAARAEAFFRRVVGDQAWERLPERVKAQRRADGPALVAELASLRASAPMDLSALRVPVLLGRGELSVPHHRRAVEALAKLVPGAEIVEFGGASHGAHLSHPDAFGQFVRRVLHASVPAEGTEEAG